MIRFACPACNASIKVPDTAAGKKGPCPKCGQRLYVPPPVRNKGISATTKVETAQFFDDESYVYKQPRTKRGAKLALILCSVALLSATGAWFLLKPAKKEVSITFTASGVETSSWPWSVEKKEMPPPDDKILANHAFWKRPLSSAQLHAVLDRFQEKGRPPVPLVVDDEGRMVDDRGERLMFALYEKKISSRFIKMSHLWDISDKSARKELLERMDEFVSREAYDRKHQP
jgi:hypothetical protein